MASTELICKIHVKVPEMVSGTATFHLLKSESVGDVILKVCRKFHLAANKDESNTKYALIVQGVPDAPRYLPTDLPLSGFLPNDAMMQQMKSDARVELVRHSSKLLIIGLDREHRVEEVNFCRERALELILEKFAVEYSIKPKELCLVSPNSLSKEMNLLKTPLEQGLQHEDVLLLKQKKKSRKHTFKTNTMRRTKLKKQTKSSKTGITAPMNGLLLDGGALPPFLFDTMKWIEINALSTPRIFQLGSSSSSNSAVENIIRRYQSTHQNVDLNAVADPFTVCEVFKTFLGMLPLKCLGTSFWEKYSPKVLENPMEIVRLLKDEDKASLVLLRYVMSFLHRVSLKSDVNRMDAKALAEVLGPVISAESKHANIALVKILIENPEWIPKHSNVEYFPFDPLFAEEALLQTENVQHVGDDGLCRGIFLISNYRVSFIPRPRADGTERPPIHIPLASILRIDKGKEKEKEKDKEKDDLTLHTKSNRVASFSFASSSVYQECMAIISLFEAPQPVNQLFAYYNGLYSEGTVSVETIDQYDAEYFRQGLEIPEEWCFAKSAHGSSYPQHVLVPRKASEGDLVSRVARTYTGGCFPTLVYYNIATTGSILRSGTPASLIKTATSSHNLRLSIGHPTPPSLQSKRSESSLNVGERIQFMKELSPLLSNGAFESVVCSVAKENAARSTWSFSDVCRSYENLCSSLRTGAHDSMTAKLHIHQWISSISEVLTAACRIAEKLQKGRSISVEDDDFVSFSLISLAMLMMDPYYRTISGFQVVIEHVWIRFGFPFASSFGFGSVGLQAAADINTRAYFIQFIDCVWQMVAQFNYCFEFNESYLMEILEAVTSGRFGTFLGDSEQDALYNMKVTKSFWKHIQDNQAQFVNTWYDIDSGISPLLPDSTLLRITFWTTYHLQWLSWNGVHQCANVFGEFNSSSQTRSLELSHLLLSHLPSFNVPPACGVQTVDLSSNLFCAVPRELSRFAQLDELNLQDNLIKFLPSDLISLLTESCPQLKSLNLRENQLTVIDDSLQKFSTLTSLQLGGSGTFSSKLPPSLFLLNTLEVLSIEGFKLIEAPDDLYKMVHLKSLSLAQNCLTSLNINSPHLEMINLRHNQLTSSMIKISGCEQTLTSLDISYNRLDVIPHTVFSMTNIEKLQASNNQLSRVPPYIKSLSKLSLLDVSHNQITELTVVLGELSCLQSFKFKENPIVFPEKKILSQTTGAILKSLRDHLGKVQPARRIRLMVVGQENVGKSSVSHALRTGTPSTVNISTDGISIHPWEIEVSSGNQVSVEVWDFAGQEIYYTTHQLFLCEQALYMVVWNIMDNEETTKLHYWLESIKTVSKGAPTILVATHIDQELKEKAHVTLNKLANKYHQRFPFIKAITAVSCATCAGFPEVEQRIKEIIQEQSFLEASVPNRFLCFERQLLWERSARHPPVMSLGEYTELAELFSIPVDDVSRMSKMLHNWGTILYYEDAHLKDTITLDPRWLIQLLSDLITTKHRYIKQGVIEHADLIHIWHTADYPVELHRTLMTLLNKFSIAFPVQRYLSPEAWNKGKSIIPSALPVQADIRVSQIFPRFEATKQYARDYKISFVPSGFLNYLIIQLIEQLTDIHYWRYGIAGFSNESSASKLLVELNPTTSMLKAVARGESSMKLFLMAVSIIESFIEHWSNLEVIVSIPCPHCFQECAQASYSFPYTLCKEAALTEETYLDCRSGSSVRLDLLVPDLSMAEVTRVDYNKVHIIQEIGRGGFATVYKAKYEGKIVALKKLDIVEGGTAEEIFDDFTKETWIMNGVQHPNIIGFHGLCTSPLCIITDFAAHGNLYEFLHDEKNKEAANQWSLKVRIALDIAHGMSFLHNRVPAIIHSDLKSPNVLLHSIDPLAPSVAVVADFGLSKSWVPVLQGRKVDNPVWLAPEILAGKDYSERADVYAFGVILYEILTLQAFFGEFTFLSAMEDAIIAGERPPIHVESEKEKMMQVLIEDCWQNDPEKRPTFSEIAKHLRSIAQKTLASGQIMVSDHAEVAQRPSRELHIQESVDEAFAQSLPRENTTVTHAVLTNHGSSLWCCESDGSVTIWDVEDKYSQERTLPLYYAPIAAIVSLSHENVIWTVATSSRSIHVWCGVTARLLMTIPCPYQVNCFVELENDVCAGTAEGLLLLWSKDGTPSRFDRMCPVFSPRGVSAELKAIQKALFDPMSGVPAHAKQFINETVCYYHYFTRAALRNWLVSKRHCKDSPEEVINQLLHHNIIQAPFSDSTTGPQDSDLLITPTEFFRGLEVVQGSSLVTGLKLVSDSQVGEVCSLYFDRKEGLLWVGGTSKLLVLSTRTFSPLATIELTAPAVQIVRVRDSLWVASNAILVCNKFTLACKRIEGAGKTCHLAVVDDTVWSSSTENTITVWAVNCRFVKEITLKAQTLCTAILSVPGQSQVITALNNHGVMVWNARKAKVKSSGSRSSSMGHVINEKSKLRFSLDPLVEDALQRASEGAINLVTMTINFDTSHIDLIEEDRVSPNDLADTFSSDPCFAYYYYKDEHIDCHLFLTYIPQEVSSEDKRFYWENSNFVHDQTEETLAIPLDRSLVVQSKTQLFKAELSSELSLSHSVPVKVDVGTA